VEEFNWQEFTNDIVEELLEDGSNSEAMYSIEHHFVAFSEQTAEAALQQAFRKGWNVSEVEEAETADGELVLCFDVETECPLDEVIIYEEVESMLKFAEALELEYDGWGTHFED
jgi:hypothetical protein